jgi:hypothetical protein
VFDQGRNSWCSWDGSAWTTRRPGDEPVIEHIHFTGTGTRVLEDNGRAAIKALFDRSF